MRKVPGLIDVPSKETLRPNRRDDRPNRTDVFRHVPTGVQFVQNFGEDAKSPARAKWTAPSAASKVGRVPTDAKQTPPQPGYNTRSEGYVDTSPAKQKPRR